MKKDLVLVFLVGSLVGVLLGAALWVPVTAKIMEAQFEKGIKPADIYPTGSFTLTFLVNEDVIDLEGKEALTDFIEQLVMDLTEASAGYRIDGDVGHIRILTARLRGDKYTESRLKEMLSIKPSDKD
jgi:hypothetical protein